jgi:hypothetical protein
VNYRGYKAAVFLVRIFGERDDRAVAVSNATRKIDGAECIVFTIGDDRAILTLRELAYLPRCCELASAKIPQQDQNVRHGIEALASLARYVMTKLDDHGMSPYGPH